MVKKMCSALLIIVFMCVFSLSVFAAPPEDDADVSAKSAVEENAAVGSGETGEEEKAEISEEDIKSNIDPIIKDKDIEATDQFLVTITEPVGDKTDSKKSYFICGVTDKEDIRIAIALYDKDTDSYVDLPNTDGVSSWDIEDRLFAKGVSLDVGTNKIKLIAFVKSEADKLKAGENLQVNYFTITVLKESFVDKVKNGILKAAEIFEKILPDNNKK